jgi:hypothetical protein
MENQPPPVGEPPKDVRKPRKLLSEEDKKALLAILQRPDVRVDGKIHTATVCRLTGLSASTIYTFLKSDRYLNAQLAEVNPDTVQTTEVELIDRDEAPTLPLSAVNFQEKDLEEARALHNQELKVLAKDWEALGMTPEQGKKWEAFCRLGKAPTYAILRGVGGQLISDLTTLDEIIKQDADMILGKNLPVEKKANGEERPADAVARDWRYCVYQGMNLRLNMFAHLHKSQAILAHVARDLQALQNAKPGNGVKGEYKPRDPQKKTGKA